MVRHLVRFWIKPITFTLEIIIISSEECAKNWIKDQRIKNILGYFINSHGLAHLWINCKKRRNHRAARDRYGTLDVSVLELGDGVFEVKATNGDTHLGGEDYQTLLSTRLLDDFKSKEGIDLRKDNAAMQRLKDEAEKREERIVDGWIWSQHSIVYYRRCWWSKDFEMSFSEPR